MSKVCVDGCVSRSSNESLSVLLRNVSSALLPDLAQSQVDHIDLSRLFVAHIAVRTKADEEIIRFDVPVEVVVFVQLLDAVQDLDGNLTDTANAKLPPTRCEQLLQRVAQFVHNHDLVVVMSDKAPYSDKRIGALKRAINLVLES